MEKLNFDDVFKKANDVYVDLKKKKHPYQAPEIFEGVVMSSDSIKAILHVVLDAINVIIEENNSKESLKFVDEDFKEFDKVGLKSSSKSKKKKKRK